MILAPTMMQFITCYYALRTSSILVLDFGLFGLFSGEALHYIINPDFVNGMLQESARIIYRELDLTLVLFIRLTLQLYLLFSYKKTLLQ